MSITTITGSKLAELLTAVRPTEWFTVGECLTLTSAARVLAEQSSDIPEESARHLADAEELITLAYRHADDGRPGTASSYLHDAAAHISASGVRLQFTVTPAS